MVVVVGKPVMVTLLLPPPRPTATLLTAAKVPLPRLEETVAPPPGSVPVDLGPNEVME